MHHTISDPLMQWEKCAILYKERDCWAWEGTGGGHTLGDSEIFVRPLLHQGFPRDISLCDSIDITIISALSPCRPIVKEKCHPFRFSHGTHQAGRQAASQALLSLHPATPPPSCEAPLERYKLDLARILASSQMLCVAAWCQRANSPSPAALISTGRLLARHLLEALHTFFFFFL